MGLFGERVAALETVEGKTPCMALRWMALLQVSSEDGARQKAWTMLGHGAGGEGDSDGV